MARRFEYLIALGSNLGDRLTTLHRAITQIETRCGKTAARSSFYRTKPIGAADQEFINGAIAIESSSPPETVMTTLLSIEEYLGRTRDIHWGNRTIDLDLILARQALKSRPRTLYENLTIKSAALKIPHPRMLERDFVLVPAAEIAPNWVHPISGLQLQAESQIRFPNGLEHLINTLNLE